MEVRSHVLLLISLVLIVNQMASVKCAEIDNTIFGSQLGHNTFERVKKYFHSQSEHRITPEPPSTQWTFNVRLSENLLPFEVVGISGDDPVLGNWDPAKAVLLNITEGFNTWSATVKTPTEKTIAYRFFIGAVDSRKNLQIRRWETHLNPRTINTKSAPTGESTDHFGVIDGVKQVRRGWLTTETLLQLKLFRNPFAFNENVRDRKIFLKLTPVDYDLESNKEKLYTTIAPSTRAYAEYVRMQYGNSVIKPQEEFGAQYEDDDILIFHVTLADLKNVAFQMKVYQSDEQNSDLRHLLGFMYIHPAALNDTQGVLDLPIISPVWLNSIGTVRLEYLAIKPFTSPLLNMRTTFANYWRQNWTNFDVGHRGLGKSLKLAADVAPPIVENTIASLKEAGIAGADIVEFDVQLTKDLIPIIAHDYSVRVCLESKKPTSSEDLTEVMVKDLTYDQLKALKTYQIVNGKIVEYPAHDTELREDYRLFPTLEELFEQIDPSIGFDIEIKWPQDKLDGTKESEQTIDKNEFLDHILEVVMRKGCGRLSFFTSFDADICTMLRFKQNMYPVMFLSHETAKFVDPRSDTIKDTVNQAQAFDLLGIVPNTANVLRNTRQVKLATDLGQQVFIWGDEASTVETIAFFKETGANGVIFDRMDLNIPDTKGNGTLRTEEMQALFQLQCSN